MVRASIRANLKRNCPLRDGRFVFGFDSTLDRAICWT